MRTILLTVALLLSFQANAEDKKAVVVNNGIICDSEADVAELLQHIVSGQNRYHAASLIPGCGMVVRPFPAILSTVSHFILKNQKVPIVKFEALEGFTQYSFGQAEPENSTI